MSKEYCKKREDPPLSLLRFDLLGTSVLCLFFVSLLPAQDLRTPQFMTQARKGFGLLHNLDYPQASHVFSGLKEAYLFHPAPPLYLGVSIWLKTLFDRRELDLDHFTAPGHFSKPTTYSMSPQQRQIFLDYIQKSQELSQAILQKNPQNQDARYFLGSSYGILGAFATTIDRSKKRALNYGKKAHQYHSELLGENPHYYDSYMIAGLYEYIVGSLPWYIKWLAQLLGHRGSKERGLKYLDLTVQKGDCVADDARVFQMVLFLREGNYQAALENTRVLHQKYPRNYILHLNQAQVLERMGEKDQAVQKYQKVLQLAEAKQPNYHKLPLNTAHYYFGEKFLELHHPELAIEQFQKSINNSETPEQEKAFSHLGAGQVLDLLGKRSEAVTHYERVLNFKNFQHSHKQARAYLKTPYRRVGKRALRTFADRPPPLAIPRSLQNQCYGKHDKGDGDFHPGSLCSRAYTHFSLKSFPRTDIEVPKSG